MSKLKVIQLLPELNFGGVERGTKDMSKALISEGHDSIVTVSYTHLTLPTKRIV